MHKFLSFITNKIFLVLIAIVNLGMLSLSLAFAWFSEGVNQLSMPISDGSVVTNYFHCGNGSQDNPFVITKPIHYYNLIMLYQKLSGFATSDYYFEFGYDLNNDGNKVVYNFDDDGVQVTTSGSEYSSSLNMSYYDQLLPIGTSSVPFNQHFEGNGLTITNLKIVSQIDSNGTADLGVFGYVTDSAVIENVFFNNLRLNLTNIDYSDTSTNHTSHTSIAYVGYIIGHLKAYDEAKINHLYVSGATINGGNAASDGYGFIGYVESGLGTVTQYVNTVNAESPSNDYSFELNAANAYSFLGSISDHFSDTLVTQNWGYSSQGSTLSEGINSSNSTYILYGDAPDNSASINYSFNTIGYYGSVTTQSDYYDAYYKNGDTYSILPVSSLDSNASPSTQTSVGNYYYYDSTNSKWCYYNCSAAGVMNKYNVTFTTSSASLSVGNKGNSITSATATIYIDGVGVSIDCTDKASISNYTLSLSSISLGTYSLAEGTHYIGVLINVVYKRNWRSYNAYAYYGERSGSVVNGKSLVVTEASSQTLSLTNRSNNSTTFSETNTPSIVYESATYTGPYDIYYSTDSGTTYNSVPSDGEVSNVYNEMKATYPTTSISNAYISDLYANYKTNGIKSGYNAKNIDIVGYFVFNSNYLYLNGYSNDTNTLDSGDFGSTFYGNVNCSCAFLLYIKNIPDAESMGTIDVYYSKYDGNANEEEQVQFNRYAGNYITFKSGLGGDYKNSGISYNGTSCSKLTASLTETTLANSAYCGIDSENNIIAIPSSSGGLTYQTGKTVSDVAYFVLMMAIQSGHTKFYGIDFEFKAEDGNTGSDPEATYMDLPLFTDIDYRTSNDTIVEGAGSLLLVSFNCPNGATDSDFSVSIAYATDSETCTNGSTTYTGVYIITILNTDDPTFDFSVLMVDNDSDATNVYPYAYRVSYNGTYIENVATTYFQICKNFNLTYSSS